MPTRSSPWTPDPLNYRLSEGSPLIDAGADVGLTEDFAGCPIPARAGPDIGAFESAALLTCVGFEPPLDSGPVTVKKNRVLPLKAVLSDADGNPITDLDIVSPPVIQVLYSSAGSAAIDVTDDALPAGQGTEGNQFDYTGGKWRFNLKTKNYNAAGPYTIKLISGDKLEYSVAACDAYFVRQ